MECNLIVGLARCTTRVSCYHGKSASIRADSILLTLAIRTNVPGIHEKTTVNPFHDNKLKPCVLG